MNYIKNIAEFTRRKTIEVRVGETAIGGDNPIRIQTMTTTNTNDTEATVEQCIRAIDAGAEIVRITTQGIREATNLQNIKRELLARGYNTPIVADVHFNPAAALEAAKHVEKVRINPGNFVDPRAKFQDVEYTDDEYQEELKKIEEKLIPLIEICKSRKVAIRIGVNHGSLSDRIMSRYGDTPQGMVESAMEFLRIFRSHGFNNIVISMKSSNTRVMVQAVRLLVATMQAEGMNYPLHLGVTEAGDGEDGRIKSAVGIGALLADGIGDTIRVSLTEEPENEIPVAKKLVSYFSKRVTSPKLNPTDNFPYNPFEFSRRVTREVNGIGGNNPPKVFAFTQDSFNSYIATLWGWRFNTENRSWSRGDIAPDFFVNLDYKVNDDAEDLPVVSKHTADFCTISIDEFLTQRPNKPILLEVSYNDLLNNELLVAVRESSNVVLLLKSTNADSYTEQRAAIIELMNQGLQNPVVVSRSYNDTDKEAFQLKAAADLGGLLIDGLADGIMITSPVQSPDTIASTAFAILQAARMRITKTEYIACPGCGRTLFSLQQTLQKVRSATSHLKGLKIGVMGCIVNGPGEMADADYGYVGAGPGRVTLYKGKTVVKKNIPEEHAIEELISIIKENGDWVESV
jgi:(E)-4-hydroxy-3-methylbut-2-enyl-diphosphate synthase